MLAKAGIFVVVISCVVLPKASIIVEYYFKIPFLVLFVIHAVHAITRVNIECGSALARRLRG